MDASVVDTSVADGPRPVRYLAFVVCIWCDITFRASVSRVVFIIVVGFPRLGITAPHAHVSPYANAASLISDDLAQRCALLQPGELLGAVDGERFGSDFEPEVDMRIRSGWVLRRLFRSRVRSG